MKNFLKFACAAAFVVCACSDDSSSDSMTAEEKEEAAKSTEADSSTYKLLMDSSKLKKMLGSSHVKLAFRNEATSNLVLIDVEDDSMRVETLSFDLEVFHPQYSPDGSKLAFSTSYEGGNFKADLFVLDLDADSSLIKLEVDGDPDIDGATIPRWRVLESGDTVIVYNSYSGSNGLETWLRTSTWQVPFSKGKFGTPEKLFNRAYNGGVAYDNSFAVTGAPQLLIHFANDPDSVNVVLYNGEQVCNTSLARDSSGIFTFLETAGQQGLEYVGLDKYKWHEFLFFTDSTGEILDTVRAPDGYMFYDTEWLAKSGILIGTITIDNYERSHIVLIDAAKHTVVNLLESLKSVEMWHPDLWVEP